MYFSNPEKWGQIICIAEANGESIANFAIQGHNTNHICNLELQGCILYKYEACVGYFYYLEIFVYFQVITDSLPQLTL